MPLFSIVSHNKQNIPSAQFVRHNHGQKRRTSADDCDYHCNIEWVYGSKGLDVKCAVDGCENLPSGLQEEVGTCHDHGTRAMLRLKNVQKGTSFRLIFLLDDRHDATVLFFDLFLGVLSDSELL